MDEGVTDTPTMVLFTNDKSIDYDSSSSESSSVQALSETVHQHDRDFLIIPLAGFFEPSTTRDRVLDEAVADGAVDLSGDNTEIVAVALVELRLTIHRF